jgi:hypothetical protein
VTALYLAAVASVFAQATPYPGGSPGVSPYGAPSPAYGGSTSPYGMSASPYGEPSSVYGGAVHQGPALPAEGLDAPSLRPGPEDLGARGAVVPSAAPPRERSTAELFYLFEQIVGRPISAIGGAPFRRDTRGRVTGIGPAQVDYDRNGRVVRVAGMDVVYDTAGRVIGFGGEQVRRDSTGRVVMVGSEPFAYDSRGRITFIGGARVDRDSSGRVLRIGDEAVTYDSQGRWSGYGATRIYYQP